MFIGHFPQKSHIISGSFAENDLRLEAFYGSSPLCIIIFLFHMKRKIFATSLCPMWNNNVLVMCTMLMFHMGTHMLVWYTLYWCFTWVHTCWCDIVVSHGYTHVGVILWFHMGTHMLVWYCGFTWVHTCWCDIVVSHGYTHVGVIHFILLFHMGTHMLVWYTLYCCFTWVCV